MKKTLSLFLLALLTIAPFFAESNQNDEASDWKEQGKKALEETGKFFSKVGESVKEKVDEASEIKCYGKWTYKTENCTTTFICNENGTMEITKKVNGETDYWTGTYSATFKFITFTITESGRKGIFKNLKGEEKDLVWRITYFPQDDGTIKIISSDIPTDIDKTDFGKGAIFTKK